MDYSIPFFARSESTLYNGKRCSRDEPSGSKAMGLYLEAGCKRKIWSGYLASDSSAGPSTINVIEAVRLCAFAPPSSSLDRRCLAVFSRSMNIRVRAAIFSKLKRNAGDGRVSSFYQALAEGSLFQVQGSS
jgi:hypothetical protein